MSSTLPSSDVVSLSSEGKVALITINWSPVNVLSHAVRVGLLRTLTEAKASADVQAIVLLCAGRTFIAGADVSEFGRPIESPELHDIIQAIEDSSKPVVAAIHGSALGGGLEIALACHCRVATPSARLGLPEVLLGLIPGAGGTQRLPRLVGAEAALEMIVSGKPIAARRALNLGLIDAFVTEEQIRSESVLYAGQVAGTKPVLARNRNEKIAIAKERPEIINEFMQKNPSLFRGSSAPGTAVEAIQASIDEPFDVGIARETALFQKLFHGTEAAARRHAFFAERTAAKIPAIAEGLDAKNIRSVGIVGAGTMGGGIAMNFLNIGIPVTIVDTSREGLDRGIAVIRRNYESSAKRGGLNSADVDKRMSLLQGSLDLESLSSADLIVEAVYESMDVKKAVFGALDGIAKRDAILATNTSFLNVDEIALATSRPQQVLGLHFFSPANVMKLLEIVRGEKTDAQVIGTAMALAKRIGKIGVLSGVCDGFIANRAMAARWHEADRLILEGPTPTHIDRALESFGFAMGHFAMMDLVGLDVVGRDVKERSVMSELVSAGRLGQKSGAGYFDYDAGRKACPSALVERLIRDFAAETDNRTRSTVSETEIQQRLLYPVVNEAAKILEEGIALRPSDIDIALISGYGWPVQTGGPTFWADSLGVHAIVERLEEFQAQLGGNFAPCKLLRSLALSANGFSGFEVNAL